MKRIDTIFLFFLVVSFFAFKQNVYGQFILSSDVTSNGATLANNSNYSLSGTLGQPIVGEVNNATIKLNSGFWPVAHIVVDVSEDNLSLPLEFKLFNNYPNPFNPSTTIKYSIKERSLVKLMIYDILGREIGVLVNEEQIAGSYEVKLDASNLPSGIYFYRLQAGEFVDTKKMILLK